MKQSYLRFLFCLSIMSQGFSALGGQCLGTELRGQDRVEGVSVFKQALEEKSNRIVEKRDGWFLEVRNKVSTDEYRILEQQMMSGLLRDLSIYRVEENSPFPLRVVYDVPMITVLVSANSISQDEFFEAINELKAFQYLKNSNRSFIRNYVVDPSRNSLTYFVKECEYEIL